MSKDRPKMKLPAEAEPAREFIEALVETHERRIAELEDQVQELVRTNRQLLEQLEKLTPRNSSLPPSTEHPHAKPKRKRRPDDRKQGQRKRGGQKGHQRHQRELVPTEKCQDVIVCGVENCRRCGGEIAVTDRPPRRHQVWEIPPIEPVVTEYQLQQGHCRRCAITTEAGLPAGVPGGQCGPRLAAFAGLLMGHFRQSKRRAALFLEDLLNIPCSPAWTVKIQNRVSAALEPHYQQLRSELAHQRQLFIDESPTKQQNEKAWLWVAVASAFTVFGVFLNRKRESLRELVGDYTPVLIHCDRARMYLDADRLQWCWAHLKRDIQKLRESSDGKVKRLGDDLMRQQKLLFQHWRRYRADEIKWSTLQRHTRPIRKEFNALLLRGSFSGVDRLIGFCNELLSREECLWTFIEIQGIEPTNNTAERALRPAVIQRKLSFGTQSDSGSRFLERILIISETCRQQNRSAYEFLTEAIQSHFAGETASSGLLLPADSQPA